MCLLFALALLAGAISNAKYAADNNKLYDDEGCDSEGGYDRDVCEDLERVANAEATAAVSSQNASIVNQLHNMLSIYM